MTSGDSDFVSIRNGSLSARVIPFGASLAELRHAACGFPLVLGYPDPAIYRQDRQFMGAIIGRYANRIAKGRFPLNGQFVDIEKNERGEGHLHGGDAGFWNRDWQVTMRSATHVSLSLTNDDGEAGYPGKMVVSARYEIVEPATLRLSLEATCDRDTIVNICHHPYFNFSGDLSIDTHELTIHAKRYLPSTDDLIPTGEIASVAGTAFDFTSPRRLPAQPFNNTYALHSDQSGPLAHAASLSRGRLEMELWTTQPGLHLYDGYKLKGAHDGHLGVPYPARSGICLEPQAWPNSPNQRNFPSTILSAKAVYRQVNEYRFLIS
ncbi:aldose epimerase family protein [Roseibium aggregatum]|uniref:aldose epimerase family protein n=1 Tax=Roseibium aggregatum TaxID=187304 RepID=UPI0025ACA5C7|nr:aldose epimerase family protein [Roseibium aggregatum]WJS05641.1 aldose epimerase family protein [Roseibium aggregatum]